MALHSFELQKAIFSRLNGGSIVDEQDQAITGVFDDVPEGSAYPYVVIGEETATNIGTKDKDMHEYTQTIHVWSQYRGLKEIKEIMEQIYTLLNDFAISVSGASAITLRHEFQTTLTEGDGLTRHGVMRFRVVVSDS
jgi:hypothetical protein|tara:strand:+ start:1385 stop:1795 length:411 start_codon:yes stop_codon:yes gene_type:complete